MSVPESPYGVVTPLLRRNIIGFDFETHAFKPGSKTPRAVCMSLYGHGDPPEWVEALAAKSALGAHVQALAGGKWEALLLRDTLADGFLAMLDDDAVKIAHFASFDLGVGCRAVAELRPQHAQRVVDAVFRELDAGRILDTGIRDKLIDIAYGQMNRGRRHTLAAIVERRFGEDISADKKDPLAWRTRYHELDGVPLVEWPEKARRYAVEDSLWAVAIALDQAGTLGVEATTADGSTIVRGDGSVVNEVEQVRAQWALHLMSAWGVRTDGDFIDAWEAEMIAEMEAGERAALDAGFAKVDKKGKVSRVMREMYVRVAAAYEAQGLPVPYTGTMLGKGDNAVHRVKTDHDTLMDSKDPALVTWAESVFAGTMVNTWIPKLRGGADHALTSAPSVLVNTGRCAWRDPPLHQPPRGSKFRQCFRARDGYVYASCDWNSAELGALAQIKLWMFDYCPLADAINAGLDPHLGLAAELMGIPYEEAKRLRAEGDKTVADRRQFAKIGNFGFMGGLGSKGFVEYAKGYGVILPQYPDDKDFPGVLSAYELHTAWKEKWDAVPYLENFSRQAGRWEHGFVYPQWVSGRLRGGVGYTDGCNTGPQGLVADAAKTAAWMVSRASYLPDGGYDADGNPDGSRSPLYGSRPWLLLHDEILAEVPEATAHEAGMELQRLMIMALRFYTPDVLVGAETALSRRWHKAAEPVFRDGRLIPWDDQ